MLTAVERYPRIGERIIADFNGLYEEEWAAVDKRRSLYPPGEARYTITKVDHIGWTDHLLVHFDDNGYYIHAGSLEWSDEYQIWVCKLD